MKNISTIALLLLLLSCSKEKDQNFDKIIFSLLDDTTVVIDTIEESTDLWAYGFKFRTLKNGNISHLGMKIPTKGTFNATLWDLDNNVILRQVNITSDNAHKEIYHKISDVTVNPNMNLGIMLTANTFYNVQRSDNKNYDFPLIMNNIVIDSYYENTILEIGFAKFPETKNDTQVSPCIDFVFIDQ
jgi:hypothetical protein